MSDRTDLVGEPNERADGDASSRGVAFAAGATSCPASARLETGPSSGAWFNTLAPFEHFDSIRTQRFPHTCTAALDAENMRVFTADQLVGKVAALDFDPQRGFTRRWEARQTMGSFWAVVGDRDHRQVIGTDYANRRDHAVWRDAATGQEIARSAPLDQRKNPDIVTPGFDGKFYYMAVKDQKVLELSPVPRD